MLINHDAKTGSFRASHVQKNSAEEDIGLYLFQYELFRIAWSYASAMVLLSCYNHSRFHSLPRHFPFLEHSFAIILSLQTPTLEQFRKWNQPRINPTWLLVSMTLNHRWWCVISAVPKLVHQQQRRDDSLDLLAQPLSITCAHLMLSRLTLLSRADPTILIDSILFHQGTIMLIRSCM